MLLAIEPLFLHGGDQMAVLDEGGGGVTVVRVYPQDVQAFSLWNELRRAGGKAQPLYEMRSGS
jgi:hypothetical protein